MTPPSTDATRPQTPRRLPVSVLVVVTALALQALALAWLVADALLHLGSGALPTGARMMLVVIYVIVAAWVAASAVGMARGRAWTRGAATAIELFGVLLATWLLSMGATTLGVALLVTSGVALVTLFSAAVRDHLAR